MSSEQKELRIGVIGVGARSTLAQHVNLPQNRSRLVAAVDPVAEGRERVEELLGSDVSTFATVAEMIDFGVDAAFVTSPDDTHADITCQLLLAGVHVYLEKPLAITMEDADRVLETAYHTGTKLYVGHNMRHMAVVRLMRDIIQRGEIGEVKALWCRHFVGNGGDYYFKDWHADRKHATGLLLQKGAHDIDVMHWLADSTTAEVVAMGDLMIYGSIDDRQTGQEGHAGLMTDWFSFDHWPPESLTGLNPVVDVEDISMMLMRLRSGALASYQQCHFTPDYWRNYTVIGSRGRLENFGDGEGGEVRVWNKRAQYNPAGDKAYPISGDAHGHDDADELTVEEFINFVRHGHPTDTSPLGARDAVAAGIAATTSLREGSIPVRVPEVQRHLAEYFASHQKREQAIDS